MDLTTANYDSASIAELIELFRSLRPFSGCDVGNYEAELLGPWWLKKLAQLSLPLVGLPGWSGKRIEEKGAVNRCRIAGKVQDRVPMQRLIDRSWLDGNDCLVLSYDQSAPLLLRPMRDEFRVLDSKTLLGLSIYNLPGARRIPLPFLLRYSA